MADLQEILTYLEENKAITLIKEVMVKFPDVTIEQVKTPEVIKILENHKTEMKLMVKAKLFKNGSPQSLLELDKILDDESVDNQKINNYISKTIKEWSDEL